MPASARNSCLNNRIAVPSTLRSVLSATFSPVLRSCASYTTPMPPMPSWRISWKRSVPENSRAFSSSADGTLGMVEGSLRRTHYRSCTLCEATCGVAIEVEGEEVISIRGDDQDPFSKGYICPKATALADLHADPDRLRHPMVREGTTWREVGWDEAFDLVAGKLA